ncbi:MAG: UDP-N-acetylglucosamine--N-acetylmuramyl-(pentapeptide) pyrophosphoryl-undecaprenol N-acetylglucosamine transferase [Chlamydiae bacterium]|nr:UDP-N-acetylglucosamine--N-acetylmuramyl-(pentapeptide) pyrophosphoryl-undecaprenol N-acetylglucosamine transferase [Chlamydiota bacterium]
MSEENKKQILFAVGGTGGHILPAEALAHMLIEEDPQVEILFAGGRLSMNPYFHRDQFDYREVEAESPFRGNPLKALLSLRRGRRECEELIDSFSPSLVVGFGSFYSFPLLWAARKKGIPYILVESNAHPGRVNRLFSLGALYTAIQFPETAERLKGETRLVQMPIWSKRKEKLSKPAAKKHYGLDPDALTLLIFGGSQGADPINEAVSTLPSHRPFQLLHICGTEERAPLLSQRYKEQGVRAHVKSYEEEMDKALAAADLVICRSGAGTLAELISYRIPSILIPWPGAAENHQQKNAEIFAKRGGAILLLQSEIHRLPQALEEAQLRLEMMREALSTSEKPEDLSFQILKGLQMKTPSAKIASHH